MKLVIGKTTEGHRVEVDPKALIAGHLLIQASSGGGKSWLIRPGPPNGAGWRSFIVGTREMTPFDWKGF